MPQIILAQEKGQGGNRDKSMKRIHKNSQNNTNIRDATDGEKMEKFKNLIYTQKDI